MRMALALLVGLSAGSTTGPAAITGDQVDAELVLAVDVSGSMDAEEIAVQRLGYADALRHPDFVNAVQSGMIGRVAVTYYEWAGDIDDASRVDWQVIATVEDAEAFAALVAARPPIRRRGTSISAALDYGSGLFAANGVQGMRRIIDVSGDGPNNRGLPVVPARDAALAQGVIINGLAIMIRPSASIVGLDRYYADCVTGGPGSFVLPVHKTQDFTAAIRRKLVMEIGGTTPGPRVIPVAAPMATDCMIGEKLRYDGIENR
ncbi:MAG: DUF1194 domain-containing protein [Allorhizobium sp.]